MRIKEFLSPSEIRKLTAPSDTMGWLSVLFDWFVIGGALAACALFPYPWTIFAALIIIGGRQIGLAMLVHEAAHRCLFRTPWLNEFVSQWVCGGPVWQDLPRFRAYHLKHHKNAGTSEDPDLSIIQHFPIRPASLMRKVIRDLTGLTGMKRLYGLLLMDLGFLTYTITGNPKPIPQKGRSILQIARSALKNMHRAIITNLALFSVLWWTGKPWLYLVWLGSYLTTTSLFLRIRSIMEHACTARDPDPFKNARTTVAGFLARMTVAPHCGNYHIEHHLLMVVPYFNLPTLHQTLRSRCKFYEGDCLSKSYRGVFKAPFIRVFP